MYPQLPSLQQRQVPFHYQAFQLTDLFYFYRMITIVFGSFDICFNMLDLFKELDFSKEIEENRQLRLFLIDACKKVEQEETQHLRKIKKPELDDQLMNQFVVSGIPTLKPEQEKKFLTIFKDKLLAARNIGDKNGLVSITAGMENGVGNQTLYLTYRTPAEAKAAFNKLNNLKFDPTHPMSCVWANDLRALIEQENQPLNAQFRVPTFAASQTKRQHNIDEQLRNQFLLREDKSIYLQWLDHLDKSSASTLGADFRQMDYTINKIVFSPQGSYLAVCCSEGVHIYLGNDLKHKGLLRQVNAIDAKFSYDQRFIVTSNGNLNKHRENFILWALEEEIKIKAYKAHAHQNLDAFEFSEDSQNLAIAMQNDVTFYKLNSVEQLLKQVRAPEEEQHIIKAPHVQKIAWLKLKNEIIVMCYEPDYNPMSASATKIFLYNVQNRHERKWRAWGQHAKNGEIFLSEKGEWVAIALRKFVKKGHFATVVQIASLLKKQDNLQISSLQFKQDVGNISFDSYNNRLGVIYKDDSIKSSINLRYIVSFYELSTRNQTIEVHKVGEIPNNLQNRVIMTSNGSFFALYNITDESAERGRFSLGLITRQPKDKSKKQLNFEFTKQNLMVNGMTFFQVDPSGRFILLGTEKGYQVWNFIGEIITKDTLQKNIHDVQWRPRMFNHLSDQEEKAMLEQEKEIRKKYELIDDKRINALKYEKEAAKQKRKEDFLAFIAQKQAWFKGFSEVREKYLGFRESEARTDKYEIDEGFIDLQ